jgi:hypothetical protein
MVMDIDLDDLPCAHVTVEFTPFVCQEHEHMVDAWECQDCGEEFVPADEAIEWRDAAHGLNASLMSVEADNRRLRTISAVLGVFLFGFLVGRR